MYVYDYESTNDTIYTNHANKAMEDLIRKLMPKQLIVVRYRTTIKFPKNT